MGLAKLETCSQTMTNIDARCTPYYSAPETFKGKAGIASDVWSYGLVALELFGGKRAWGHINHRKELIKKLECKEVPIMSHLSAFSRSVCLMCLSYEPKERKTMLDVLQKLRASRQNR